MKLPFDKSCYRHCRSIQKGWSGDQKFCLETLTGEKRLLRLSPSEEYEKKRAEYQMLQRLSAFDIPISRPVDFGIGEDGEQVFMLLTWCDGEDAEEKLPSLCEKEQYALGVRSGEYLRKIHMVPAPAGREDWAEHFWRKTAKKIQKYRECGVRFPGDERVIAFLEENRSFLKNRPQTLQHGDYHVGNMVLDEKGTLSVIDFNRFDYGDPWEEFNRIIWSAQCSPHFATGQLKGYFGEMPPAEFFLLLQYYIASNLLSSVYWAIPFGQQDLNVMLEQVRYVMQAYDDMKNPVPTWFLEDLTIQEADGVPFRLRAACDLSFIGRYGKVYKVFDDQDSGNICFGTEGKGRRRFVKYAGAPTVRGSVPPGAAVRNLREALPVYRELRHPALIKYVEDQAVSGGHAVIFDWSDGISMGRMYPEQRQRFMELPVKAHLQVYRDLLDFFIYIHEMRYVAIDFYDGSVLYDPEKGKTTVCDIDFFQKKPYINDMGRMWGSARFLSPEEYEKGAVIDERTNVYTLGAMAFALFADYDRSEKAWPFSREAYAVVKRAVDPERNRRQQFIRELKDQWEQTGP